MQVPSFRSIALRLQDNLCFILKLQHLEIFVRSILASKVAYKNHPGAQFLGCIFCRGASS